MTYSLEPISSKHRVEIIDILNHYIANSYAAYPEDQFGYDIYDRFMAIVGDYPSVVVTDENGCAIGFGFLHAYRPEKAFRRTAEITYFILPDHTGKGLGTKILDQLIAEAKKMDIDSILANISSQNEVSLNFHLSHGFEECGRFRNIGTKFGTDFDVVWMQRKI